MVEVRGGRWRECCRRWRIWRWCGREWRKRGLEKVKARCWNAPYDVGTACEGGREGKQIHLELRETEEEIEYEIYSEEEGERVVHCRGVAGWSEEEGEPCGCCADEREMTQGEMEPAASTRGARSQV